MSRAKYIAKLLGRKREVIEIVTMTGGNESIDDVEAVEPLMKELETDTTESRNELLHSITKLLEDVCLREDVDEVKELKLELNRDFHKVYLDMAFSSGLPPQMAALDASQPWMLYWIANSLQVLDPEWLSDDNKRLIVDKLFHISPECGPFGGGVGQYPHLAGTYASINALSLCSNVENSWDRINRDAIYQWLLSLKQPDGGFKTCLEVGEVDTRGVYCALSVASMLDIMTDELCEGVVDYLVACQNYEGGFGSGPFCDEAHGGYTFCAVGSLAILNALDKINCEKLMEWCSARQYNEELGLCGRSNKLVDGCYSFWVGATAAILESHNYGECIDKLALRNYILACCQAQDHPGLRDKPGKHSDFYHTNYVLLGLAISESQYFMEGSARGIELIDSRLSDKALNSSLAKINPVYGLPENSFKDFIKHFKTKNA
ncbi:Protein farnesyltransferase subunit beta [Nakaseomyces bracarensis]|uniref:Protein farnesyltransferase subunit beta n=1 Tax=Nakaseomyces bracarensis TaxID=273131 RepID=A0ABR4NV79_9SACH